MYNLLSGFLLFRAASFQMSDEPFYFSRNPFEPKIRTGFTAGDIEYLTRSIEEGG
jgi:hypothetical protein